MRHVPVMCKEVVEVLSHKPLKVVIDGTCGAGGHALAILQHHPEIEQYVACDQDSQALAIAYTSLASFLPQVSFHNVNFCHPPGDIPPADGIILDLGVSSMQLETPERGFSFIREGPLDMRMDSRTLLTASEIVNTWDRASLERLFREYGEERWARKVAETIALARVRRSISTTIELAEVIAHILPRRGRIHPATKVFQALRIAVNDELDILRKALPVLAHKLAPGGRLVVITFHSLEDRIVKETFRSLVREQGWSLVVKKPLVPSLEEVRHNPRSRSAKLRVIQRSAEAEASTA
jgi:16S rRNA (cytosine1402-N4)-methyltransferase